jgi:16S rRNA (guanine(527)-N(7))-methyltransferase RsmG
MSGRFLTENLPLKFRPEEVELYEKHFQCLSSWNENINLVSKNSLQNAFATHYLDSIFIVDFAAKVRDGLETIDLGSGAGFPGIIHAIRFPDIKITLYEKVLKKQSFLNTAITLLDLQNVRVEGLLPETRIKKLVLARAVYKPEELISLARKRLAPGGKIILNLGGSTPVPTVFKELEIEKHETYTLPDDSGNRQVLSIVRR